MFIFDIFPKWYLFVGAMDAYRITEAQQSSTKTRLAPTPSGYLHLGNVYSFMITIQLAALSGAKILLRIDDMDQLRADDRFVQDIFDTLHFLNIEWQEGPQDAAEFKARYSQLLRQQLYAAALQELADSGNVFACTCSRAEVARAHPEGLYTGACLRKGIALDTPDACWRFNTEAVDALRLQTIDGMVEARLPATMAHFVVRRRDGSPAYQLASVVDDAHFGIDLIVRGADLWPSTLAQLSLCSLSTLESFKSITFHHHPVILDANGAKLSKSAGAASIRYLRDHGHSPDSIWQMVRSIAPVPS